MLFVLVEIAAAQGNNLSAPIKNSDEREFFVLKNKGERGDA